MKSTPTPMFGKKKKQATLTFEDLYNILMGEIEPDLCTDSIPLIKELHQDETKEEATARAEHYAWALQQFLSLWPDFIEDIARSAKTLHREVLDEFRAQSSEEEASALEILEEKFNNE